MIECRREDVTWLDYVSALAPLAVAVLVPGLTFQYAQAKDRRDWARRQRAVVYIDLLTEATADVDWLEYQLANAGCPAPRSRFDNHRMSSLDRRRLGARVAVHGSIEVRHL